MKTIDFTLWTSFKSLSQIKGNSVTDYGYLNFIVYVRRGQFGYWPRTSENLALPTVTTFRYKPRGRLLHRPLGASGCEEETQAHLA